MKWGRLFGSGGESKRLVSHWRAGWRKRKVILEAKKRWRAPEICLKCWLLGKHSWRILLEGLCSSLMELSFATHSGLTWTWSLMQNQKLAVSVFLGCFSQRKRGIIFVRCTIAVNEAESLLYEGTQQAWDRIGQRMHYLQWVNNNV